MAKVMEMVPFTLIPISSAAPRSSDTARMALPAFVLLINRVRATMIAVVTTRVTMVMPEMFTDPTCTESRLITDLKGIGVDEKISRATLCRK